MTEITRVPLRPIAKGSLTKLWIGVAVAILLAAGLAWAALPKGVEVETLTEGTGPHPGASDVVFVRYTGKLADGTTFDQSKELPFDTGGLLPQGMPMQVSGVVPGFSEGLQQMQKGGKYRLFIPADKAYGHTPPPGAPIPPHPRSRRADETDHRRRGRRAATQPLHVARPDVIKYIAAR